MKETLIFHKVDLCDGKIIDDDFTNGKTLHTPTNTTHARLLSVIIPILLSVKSTENYQGDSNGV